MLIDLQKVSRCMGQVGRLILKTLGLVLALTTPRLEGAAFLLEGQPSPTEAAKARALIEQFLREDFEYLADEGNVRYWHSRYSREHMERERRDGPTGIQWRSARPVDVPFFYLVKGWRVRRFSIQGNRATAEVEFEQILRGQRDHDRHRFDFKRDARVSRQIVHAVRSKERWFIDNPPPLHLSLEKFRARLLEKICTERQLLAEDREKEDASGGLAETIRAELIALENNEADLATLDGLLGMPNRP